MKRTMILVLLCAIMFSALTAPSLAHSGGTDGQGGHRNRSTGEYHYHHGYPAHQHTDGVCPYDFDDQTGKDSGTSSSKKTEPTKEKPTTTTEKVAKKDSLFSAILKLLGKIIAGVFIAYIGITYIIGIGGVVIGMIYGIIKWLSEKIFKRK